jgi:hypothetical protein
LVIGAIFFINFFSEVGDVAVVILDGEEIARYPLATDMEKIIESGDGQYNKIVIKDGKIFVEEASCKSQDCVNHASIDHTDEQIVCLPHKLIIAIEEGGK